MCIVFFDPALNFAQTDYAQRTLKKMCLRQTAAESNGVAVDAYGEHALDKTQCFK